MKKVFLLAFMALAFCVGSNAQTVISNNYGSPISGADGQSMEVDEKESASFWGLGYYSYDGGENYGLGGGMYTFNGIGYTFGVRSNLKFSDHQNTLNWDLLLNYSLGAYSNDDVKVLITPEIGPSLGMRSVYDYDDGEIKDDRFFIDGFVGLKATVVYKKMVLSAGYHMWAPKWKFGKEKADGFYVQLGIGGF